MTATLRENVGQLIDKLVQDLDISLDIIAGALFVDVSTIEQWRSNEAFPQEQQYRTLHQIADLRDRIVNTFKSDSAVHTWMHTSNHYLKDSTPAEATRRGHLGQIEGALEVLDSGIFV